MSGKVRLGGMALGNGVLVHGPTSWACAVRAESGEVKVASGRKEVLAPGVSSPFLRGPVRLFESVAFLPRLKRVLPEARLPFESTRTIGVVALTAALSGGVRRLRLNAGVAETLASLLALAPALASLREGSLANYHGAEHIAIGSYEHETHVTKEHERCGSHLIGPMLAAGTIGNVLAGRVPTRYRAAARIGASVGAIALSTEVFTWMTRNPDRRLARALARPGHELQHRFATAEPTAAQLEVADAALQACLALEATPA
jgi:uncharacterized protein YqhQ